MGLLSLFGKGPLSPAKVAKISKLACNPYAQTDIRMREMARLLNDGSPEALFGAIKRFAANASGNIADEDEKKWLTNQLVEIGKKSLAPLAEYISTQEQLSYALRAYRRIAGDEATNNFVLETLNRYGPDDYRSNEAKLQLIWEITQDIDNPNTLSNLVPFLVDHSDDVRWAVMDLCERAASENKIPDEVKENIIAKLSEIVLKDDNRPRIERRAAQILCEQEWQVSGSEANLPATLDEDFFLDKKRYVRRRAKRH
ncbi:MAG: hypothetical protein JW841_07645 [Deltaproteobacteria bacterium]|nr:hypothetical protein [Deltaproteobacteria bacterium]